MATATVPLKMTKNQRDCVKSRLIRQTVSSSQSTNLILALHHGFASTYHVKMWTRMFSLLDILLNPDRWADELFKNFQIVTSKNYWTESQILDWLPFIFQFGGTKLNLFYWLAHSACAIAFSSDTYEIALSPNNVQRSDVVRALQEAADVTFVEAKDESVKTSKGQHFSKQINVPSDFTLNSRVLMEDLSLLNIASDVMTPTRRSERDKNSVSRRLVRNQSSNSINSGSPTVSVRVKRNSVSSPNGSVRGSSGMRQDNALPSPYKGDDRKESDWSSLNDQPGSIAISRNEGSICSSAGPMSSNVTLGSALTSVTGITKKKPVKPQRPEKTFDFNIIDLPLLRNINRRVDLNEMVSLEYITGGSHSQIYSATWLGQSVIVKVSHIRSRWCRISLEERSMWTSNGLLFQHVFKRNARSEVLLSKYYKNDARNSLMRELMALFCSILSFCIHSRLSSSPCRYWANRRPITQWRFTSLTWNASSWRV